MYDDMHNMQIDKIIKTDPLRTSVLGDKHPADFNLSVKLCSLYEHVALLCVVLVISANFRGY